MLHETDRIDLRASWRVALRSGWGGRARDAPAPAGGGRPYEPTRNTSASFRADATSPTTLSSRDARRAEQGLARPRRSRDAACRGSLRHPDWHVAWSKEDPLAKGPGRVDGSIRRISKTLRAHSVRSATQGPTSLPDRPQGAVVRANIPAECQSFRKSLEGATAHVPVRSAPHLRAAAARSGAPDVGGCFGVASTALTPRVRAG